ncbi:MAG: O-antigen ligase family protein [Anaerolineales bacterium]|nr:O-antigen ligase family protein [Anaerolineales bacterium]MCB8950974.1 O-antigen ligase family protein [Ardenticatenales bacterium]
MSPRPPPTRHQSPRYWLFSAIIWIVALPWLLFPDQLPWLTAGMALLLVGLRVGARLWQGRFFPPTPLDSFILLYLAFAAISQCFSPVPDAGMPKLFVLIQGVTGYYLIREGVGTPRRQTWLVTGLAGALAVAAALALFTLEWPARQIINLRFLTDRLPHLGGSFTVHFNEMAGLLVLLLPFLLATAWRTRQRPWPQKALACAALVLVGGVLLLTQSRAALISLILAASAAFIWSRRSSRLLPPLLGGAALLVIVLLLASGQGQAWLATLDALSKVGTVTPTSWLVRLEIWRNAAQMLRDYPLFGAGFYAFDATSRANYPFALIGPGFDLTHAHNLWLQTGATLGWPALVTMIALWLTLAHGLWRQGSSQPLARLYGASIVGYLAFNCFDLVGLEQKPGIFVWLAMAGGAALLPPLTAATHPRRTALWRWMPVVTTLLLLPLLPRNLANNTLDQVRLADMPLSPALTAASFTGDARRQGLLAYLRRDLQTAQQFWRLDPQAPLFLQNQGQQAAYAGDYKAAVNWYDMALGVDPTAALSYLWRGVAHETLGEKEQAALDYEFAARYVAQEHLIPPWQPLIYFKWAYASAQNGNNAVALTAIQQAMELEPDNPAYYQLLGDILQALGDTAGAVQAYEKAKTLQR